MTVIAWDGRTLAADKRAVANCHTYTVTKIARVGDSLVGVSGYYGRSREFCEWLASGRTPATYPKRDDHTSFTAIVITPGPRGPTVERFEESPYPILVEDLAHAIGSGRDYARAAMYLGRSAAEAVVIAALFDENCGHGVDSLTLESL